MTRLKKVERPKLYGAKQKREKEKAQLAIN